jgi:small subunit ribosomal protein S6
MTRPYEVMIIIDADLEEETIRAAVERWLQLIESNGAERGHVDFWGKRRLAYEIKHKVDGYYVVRRRWRSCTGLSPWQMK